MLLKRLGLTRYESLLGLATLAIIVLVILPPMRGGMQSERSLRAVVGAESIARAVLDYHTDQGCWPRTASGVVDLACLTVPQRHGAGEAHAATAGGYMIGTLAGVSRDGTTDQLEINAWLEEVPIDPWNNPYRVAILGDLNAPMTPEGRRWHADAYPVEPPPGIAIVVVSAGEDGLWSTDPARLNPGDFESPAMSRWNNANSAHLNAELFGGDDVGFVLSRLALGGTP